MVPELPVAISVGRPSRRDFLGLTGGLLLVGAAGWLASSAGVGAPAPAPTPPTALLAVASTPAGAAVLVDEQPYGTTPMSLNVAPGYHVLVVQGLDGIPETRELDITETGASLDVKLWRARPVIKYLQPALPGATLVQADS
jgi:hypothetical protein